MNDVFTATTSQLAPTKPKRQLTEEQKSVLRTRLDAARAKRSELAKAGKLKARPAKPKPLPLPSTPIAAATFLRWNESDWLTQPYEISLQRLRDLHDDHELGAKLLTQRQTDEHIPTKYNCLVCRKPVADGRWIWKNDRLDPITNMFTSDVLCSQDCHERFSNRAQFYLQRAKGVA